MQAPRFWTEDGLAARLLSPLGAVTATLTARRVARPGWRAPVPVLCCGNATVGGSGKTTLVLDLLDRLQALGESPHALLRGYGGRERGPLRVQPGLHEAAQVGDEALLLAQAAPTWVARDRAAGARAAIAAGATVLILDDGLQNPGLVKDCSLLVIDGGFGFGNGRLLPAGPLREPVRAAAGRCRAAVLIGPDLRDAGAALPPGLPVLAATLVQDLRGLDLSRSYLAFAGIGRPEKFFAGLRQAGVTLGETRAFADHHPYAPAERTALAEAAAAQGLTLLTTPKDFARLPPAARTGIAVAGVTLAWSDPAAVDALLRETLQAAA
ncbi:tetraacyldisaccharide 4'-kinase [Acidisoma sp. 7E03]